MCDLYSHNCFARIMQQQYRLANCSHCQLDCNDLKFSVTLSEAKLSTDDMCKNIDDPGTLLTGWCKSEWSN